MRTEIIPLIEGRDDVWMKTYLWEDSPQLLNGRERPGVIVCAGGGYLQAGDNEAEPTALKFASMGYHAFVVHYSTLDLSFAEFYGLFAALDGNPEKTEQYLSRYGEDERARYPKPVLDLGRAMRVIRRHRDEWHVDMDRIALCGFSAGAHNCAMYAALWQEELLTGPLTCRAEELKPAAVILGYPVADYGLMNDLKERMPAPVQAFFDVANQVYTGMRGPEGEILEKTSPARLIRPGFPPAFLWASSGDHMVPVQNTLEMGRALADHGIPFAMHIFEEGEHGIGLGTQASAQSRAQVFPNAGRWSDLAGAWLEKRFALPLL